jgi:hypothetical protein
MKKTATSLPGALLALIAATVSLAFQRGLRTVSHATFAKRETTN